VRDQLNAKGIDGVAEKTQTTELIRMLCACDCIRLLDDQLATGVESRRGAEKGE
jgi:hypothetical protein